MTYTFRVEARNGEGYSPYSLSTSILAAQVPETPDMPHTEVVNENVIISWTAPPSNGSPINGYTITIIDHYLDYREETQYCDGSKPEIWQNA